MNRLEKHHLYSVLCAAVLADRRILDIEIETFIKVGTGLQVALKDPNPDDQNQLRRWFEDNYLVIAESVLTGNWQTNIATHLKPLQHVEYKWQILQAIKSIAISDGKFHKSEVDILRFAVDYWEENRADYFKDDMHGIFGKSIRSEPSNLDMFASKRFSVGR